MWRLYSLLKPAIENRDTEKYLLDEVDKIINLSNSQVLLECINILYDNSIEFDSVEQFSVLFLDGLVQSGFFDFVDFIRGLDGVSK